jgi:hypothetical protein
MRLWDKEGEQFMSHVRIFMCIYGVEEIMRLSDKEGKRFMCHLVIFMCMYGVFYLRTLRLECLGRG